MGVQEQQLRIDVSREADRVVLALHGELDMASTPRLQSVIDAEEATAKTIVLDLQQLQFIDSTGLRTILTTRERCREGGRAFAITRGSEQVQRLLSVTGLVDHLPTVATPGELLV
jgi:anti-anti-sigma factor